MHGMLQLPSLYVGVHRKSALHAELTGDLQKHLLGKGYQVKVDDEFGPQTTKAVREYQIHKKIPADGWVGPKTWGLLLADGFRPGSYEEAVELEIAPWPPKPAGMRSPNGALLFGGLGFTYSAAPTKSNPERIEINPEWLSANIEQIQIPQLSKFTSKISVNKKLSNQFRLLFEIWEHQGHRDKILTYDGCQVSRFVRGRTDKVSNHSYGSAIDLNARWNGFRSIPALLGELGCIRELVPAALELGFYWGGWYNDGMHFEAFKILTEEELQAIRRKLIQ